MVRDCSLRIWLECRNACITCCIRKSDTNGPGRPVGHDSQSIASPSHWRVIVVGFGTASKGFNRWPPWATDEVVSVSGYLSTVEPCSRVALDIFETRADSEVAWGGWKLNELDTMAWGAARIYETQQHFSSCLPGCVGTAWFQSGKKRR